NGSAQQVREPDAGFDRLRGAMRRPALRRGDANCLLSVVQGVQRNKRQPHQRSVSGGLVAGIAGVWITVLQIPAARYERVQNDRTMIAQCRATATAAFQEVYLLSCIYFGRYARQAEHALG